MFTALLVLGGAACSDGGDDGGGSGAAASGTASGDDASAAESEEAPSAEFCDLLLNGQPSTSVISENITYYQDLKALAPGWLEDDLDLVVERYQAHADEGEDSVTISADADAQPALMELFGAGVDCARD
jgi:hypothetical protein